MVHFSSILHPDHGKSSYIFSAMQPLGPVIMAFGIKTNETPSE